MPTKTKPNLSLQMKKSPTTFIKSVLTHQDGSKAEPHVAQEEILEELAREDKKEAVLLTGRQFGKSVMLSWFICWYMVVYAHREVWLVAPSLDQARIIFNEVANNFRLFPLNTLLKRKPIEHPFPALYLSNGSQLHVRGANSPQFIRGHHAHLVVIDEAAFVKEGIQAAVLEPLLTVTGKMPGSKLIRISTPFGKGEFYDSAVQAMEDKTGTKIFKHFTTLDNPHIDKDRVLAVRDMYGENSLIWQTEYMANLFVSDNSVFDWDDVKWAYSNYPSATNEEVKDYPLAPVPNHRYAQGVDLANMDDFFISTVLDASNPQRIVQVKHDRYQRKGYTFYKQVVRQNHASYNKAKTLIDATSLGESVVEDLRDIQAEGFAFTGSAVKYDLVHGLVRLFAEHRILIPYDRDNINELRFYQYKITPAKNLRIEAKRGYHDDYVTSLALSGSVASRPMFTGFFRGVDLSMMGQPQLTPMPEQLKKEEPIDILFGDYE